MLRPQDCAVAVSRPADLHHQILVESFTRTCIYTGQSGGRMLLVLFLLLPLPSYLSFRAAPFHIFSSSDLLLGRALFSIFLSCFNSSVTMRSFPSVFAAIALFSAVAQAGKRGLTWTYCKSATSSKLIRPCADRPDRQQRSVITLSFSAFKVITDKP